MSVLRQQRKVVGAGAHGEQVDLFGEEEIVRPPRRHVRFELAVRDDDLELAAKDAAAPVDSLDPEADAGDVGVANPLHGPALGLEDPDLDRPRLGPARPRDDVRRGRGKARCGGALEKRPAALT